MSPARASGPAAPAGALGTLYALSGATALCYEVLWARMLALQFGVSIFGVAVTVAAFLLGLGLGALIARRLLAAAAPRRALLIFGALELSIAAYALALPAFRAAAAPALEAAAAALAPWQWTAVQAACAAALLALPAAAMGASFPAVLHAVAAPAARIGRLYGLNSLGAAAGALASLGLLAGLGWDAAIRSVAACGALVAALAWLLAARLPSVPGAPVRAPAGAPDAAAGLASRPPPPGAVLAYAGVGACALILEIAWTRLYGMVLLRTEYVLAIILAVYLAGTALGSLLAARLRRDDRLVAAVPLLASGGALAALALVPALSVWVQEHAFDSLATALAVQALLLACSTLPTTAALGAWLPLLAWRTARAEGRGADHAGAPGDAASAGSAQPASEHASVLYGANCLGAAAGAVATVWLAIPWVGTAATICLAALALLLLGKDLARARLLAAALPLAAAGAWLLHEFPAPERMLAPQARVARELFRYEDALTLNHVTQDADGQRTLLTDLQHMDASSDAAAVQIQADQARLPLLLHPAPRSVLFLGLGTGISASGSLAYPSIERYAVEISPGAVEAARTWFAPVNGGVMGRLHVEIDDARHFLAAEPRSYDVIVGDLFHPDLAGMSNLLSVEQFARARRRLNPGGVFAQWIALNQFDGESLHAILRSFREVFPGAVMFFDGMHLALVGSPAPQAWGANVLAQMAGLDPAAARARTGGEGPWTWLGRYCGSVDGGRGPLQSELRPVIEYRLPRLRYLDQQPLSGLLAELLRQRPAPAIAADLLGLPPAARGEFSDAYLAAGLAMQSWLASLEGRGAQAGERMRLAYEANARDRWIAGALADELFEQLAGAGPPADRAALERILRIYPDHVEALRALWHLDMASGSAAAQQEWERLRELVPLDHEISAAGALQARPAINQGSRQSGSVGAATNCGPWRLGYACLDVQLGTQLGTAAASGDPGPDRRKRGTGRPA